MSGLVMIELPDLPAHSIGLARQQFAQLGLPNPRILQAPFSNGHRCRYFAVYTMPTRATDCRFLTVDDEPVAVLHGSDCNMVASIDQDIRYGTQSPFQYCARRQAGGAFPTIDINQDR